MRLLTRSELIALSEHQKAPSVSIYMPTPLPAEPRKSQIAFKSVLGEVQDELLGRGLKEQEVEDLLEPAKKLLSNSMFWENQSKALAVFLSEGYERIYRIPLEVPKLAVVSRGFHIKPLLPLVGGGDDFYVLCLSKKKIRLVQCTKEDFRNVDLENVPQSISEALQYEPLEKQGQIGSAPGRQGLFHGHGAGDEDFKENLKTFLRMVDKGIRELLKDETAPLVPAGVAYVVSLYKEVASYPHVTEEFVEGSPDNLTAEELFQRAKAIVEPIFKKEEMEAKEKFEALLGTGKASFMLEEVLPAAFSGRVEVLFVPLGVQVWGKWKGATHEMELSSREDPEARDLLDLAAVETLRSRGKVYVVSPEEVPGGKDVAAIFRY
jgi:hypothetical protein